MLSIMSHNRTQDRDGINKMTKCYQNIFKSQFHINSVLLLPLLSRRVRVEDVCRCEVSEESVAFVGLASPELVVGAVEVVQSPKHSKTLREPQMKSMRGNLDTEIITISKFHINIFTVYTSFCISH